MIGYATIGTNDIDKAKDYYDTLLGEIGGKRLMEMPDERGLTMYGSGFDKPMLAVTRPYDGGEASVGNGSMVALSMDNRDQVDTFYAKAIELGGSDEGAPGMRGDASMGFYGSYFRDPEGNKFCVYNIGQG